MKWAGDTIGEPVEQGGGGQQEDGAPPQQAEVEPAPSSSASSGEEPGSASDTIELAGGAPSADDGLAMAPHQLGAGAGPVDGAEPAAKVGREEVRLASAGAIGSTHGRAAAAPIHPLEPRCFWGLILVFAGVVVGVVACHSFPVLAGVSAGGARVCTGREPTLVHEWDRCGGGLCYIHNNNMVVVLIHGSKSSPSSQGGWCKILCLVHPKNLMGFVFARRGASCVVVFSPHRNPAS